MTDTPAGVPIGALGGEVSLRVADVLGVRANQLVDTSLLDRMR